MVEWIAQTLGPWSWWLVGLILLGLEVVAPGTFFLWFGVAALIVGAISLLVDWGWQAQTITFVILAVASIVASRLFLRRETFTQSTEPALNQRAARYMGRSYVLREPIVEGEGRLHIDDTMWRISGPDSGAGTKVKIVRSEGARLFVEPESTD